MLPHDRFDLLHGRVPHISALDDVDDELGDIFGVVADPLNRFGYKQQIKACRNRTRVGDHAKNIAEFIIYIVKGADVRHTPMEQIESVVR